MKYENLKDGTCSPDICLFHMRWNQCECFGKPLLVFAESHPCPPMRKVIRERLSSVMSDCGMFCVLVLFKFEMVYVVLPPSLRNARTRCEGSMFYVWGMPATWCVLVLANIPVMI